MLHDTDTIAQAGHDAVTAECLLIDVRRAPLFEQSSQKLPGAVWRDPAAVEQWAGELPRDREVIVYCVHGHEVSQAAASRLRERGLRARYLSGGLEGWRAAGLPLAAKE
jgi:Fe-Mn family superoxide dismutase